MNNRENQTADLVIMGNALFTALSDTFGAGGIAVSGNRIIKTGSVEEIEPLISKETKVYEFDDELILPGFHDNHVHIFCGSLLQESVDLHDADSEKAAAEMVGGFAATHPENDWIIGFGWYHVFWNNIRLPHRRTLDEVVPDRPVFLFNAELHGAWVNSYALQMCGVTSKTPDPPYGKIERDEKGDPIGFLYETAMGLIAPEVFRFNKKQKTDLFQSFLNKVAALGITSISDMLPLPGMELGDPEIYREFDEKDNLTARIYLIADLSGDLSRAQKLRRLYKSDKLRFAALKKFVDGVAITYTALMNEPYSDNPETKGITLIPAQVLNEWIKAADKDGFQLRLHACGDGAARLALDCIEEAQLFNGKRDARHCLEHVENIHPEDANRFGELGMVASVQPEHLALSPRFSDNPYRPRLAGWREKFTWPNKTLLQAGAVLALGSDHPVVELDPLHEIYRAVTRVHNDGLPEGGWNPEQKLTLFEALQAYTFGPAYASFREKDLGTLEVGKLADIIVLDRNLFKVPAEEILEAKVKLTVMDGKVVYKRQ